MPKFTINPPVFFGSLAVVLGFALIGIAIPDQAEEFFNSLQTTILDRFGWFYILAVAGFVVIVLLLGLTRFGRLKLGPDDAKPDFPFMSWVAMLFAAGMGIGLMFFAVGEPMTHFAAPPEADPRTIAAQREAMEVTFFHWGIHAWAIYAVVGLSLAYFGFRYNLPLTVRSGLYPLLKERINGPWGHAVDIFAIAGTIFGIGTSLGFGVTQINAGVDYLFGIPVSTGFQVTLIAGITALASISVVTGLDKGVRRLSEANLILAVVLMLFVLFAGPTIQLLDSLVSNVGHYLQNFMGRSLTTYAYDPSNTWIDGWTLFYWAWWISWSPFVGMFIARISRGRTVRQFIMAVLFIPAGFTFVWMTVFGNTGISIDTGVADGALSAAVSEDISVALFQFFDYLPLSTITSFLAVMLVAIFFITSSDSGSLVVDSIASGGETNTPATQRLFWAIIEGVVAAALLLAGGLGALQTATIASALPFTVIMIILCWALIRGMRSDLAARAPAPAAGALHRHAPGLTWQRRLAMILNSPTADDAAKFIDSTVRPAMAEVVKELGKTDRDATIENGEDGELRLVVPADGVRNFVYGVRVDRYRLPAFTALSATRPDERFEAHTFFSDGSAGYDIMGLSTDQVISDILIQFERYQVIVQQPATRLYTTAPDLV